MSNNYKSALIGKRNEMARLVENLQTRCALRPPANTRVAFYCVLRTVNHLMRKKIHVSENDRNCGRERSRKAVLEFFEFESSFFDESTIDRQAEVFCVLEDAVAWLESLGPGIEKHQKDVEAQCVIKIARMKAAAAFGTSKGGA